MNGALLNPEEVRVTDATVTGGKGRQLAQLRHFGLPVPDFAVLPAAWSEGRGEAFPAALVTALHDGLAARGWLEQPLAVRSSAVGEDSAAASFAGIYTSCLNVQGLDGVVAAVQTVWASLDSDTARAYRARMGHAGPARMGVIVMPLLAAEASGIGFTCDPLTGREDRLVIHANRGLGETLVGGETAGDEYVFAEDSTDTWRLIESRSGSKAAAEALVTSWAAESARIGPRVVVFRPKPMPTALRGRFYPGEDNSALTPCADEAERLLATL